MGISINSANALGVPVDQPQSLQAMIELVYVQSANDVLYNHLQSLQQYLATTQNTASVLAQLQNLHNEVSVVNKGNFASGYWNGFSTIYTINLVTGNSATVFDPTNYPIHFFSPFVSLFGLSGYNLLHSPEQLTGLSGTKIWQFQGLPASGSILPANTTLSFAIKARSFVPASKYPGPVDANGNSQETEGAYRTAMSAFFGTPVGVSANFGSAGFYGSGGFSQQILAIKTEISTQLIPGLSASQVRLANGQEDPHSLLAQMRGVLKTLNSYNFQNEQSAIAWLTDNYNTAGTQNNATSGGQIQQQLTNAITAAESLNTTQTESVRNYLYLFEEYYKSATSILQQMTQIIQKMADGIAR